MLKMLFFLHPDAFANCFYDPPNWQQEAEKQSEGEGEEKQDFAKLSSQFFTLKAKVASETLLLPWSSNFASFVPWGRALERHLFTGLSSGLQLSANNTVDTHF